MSEIFLSEESKNNALLIMQINVKDGKSCQIFVGRSDDPSRLATMFVEKHNLPESVIDRICQQISQRRDIALQSDVDLISIRNFDSGEKLHESLIETEHLRGAISNGTFKGETTFNNARKNWATSFTGKSIRTISGARQRLSPSTAGVVISSSNVVPPYSREGNMKPSSNQILFERMYSYASYHRRRRELLRSQVETERVDTLNSSTFRATIGHLRNSPSNKLRRRASSTSRLGTMNSSDDNSFFEDLYERNQVWMQRRDNRVGRIRQEISEKKEVDLMASVTFHPEIATAPHLQRQRHSDVSHVFEELYDSHKYYMNNRQRLRKKVDEELSKEHYFIPQITPRSRKLVRQRSRSNDMTSISYNEKYNHAGDDEEFARMSYDQAADRQWAPPMSGGHDGFFNGMEAYFSDGDLETSSLGDFSESQRGRSRSPPQGQDHSRYVRGGEKGSVDEGAGMYQSSWGIDGGYGHKNGPFGLAKVGTDGTTSHTVSEQASRYRQQVGDSKAGPDRDRDLQRRRSGSIDNSELTASGPRVMSTVAASVSSPHTRWQSSPSQIQPSRKQDDSDNSSDDFAADVVMRGGGTDAIGGDNGSPASTSQSSTYSQILQPSVHSVHSVVTDPILQHPRQPSRDDSEFAPLPGSFDDMKTMFEVEGGEMRPETEFDTGDNIEIIPSEAVTAAGPRYRDTQRRGSSICTSLPHHQRNGDLGLASSSGSSMFSTSSFDPSIARLNSSFSGPVVAGQPNHPRIDQLGQERELQSHGRREGGERGLYRGLEALVVDPSLRSSSTYGATGTGRGTAAEAASQKQSSTNPASFARGSAHSAVSLSGSRGGQSVSTAGMVGVGGGGGVLSRGLLAAAAARGGKAEGDRIPRTPARARAQSADGRVRVGSRASSELFDKLYEARAALAANKRSLIARHQPQHAHRPDIGINAFHPVEPSKDQFFQRLYDHRHQQNALAQVNSRKYFIQEMGRDVRSDPVLAPQAEDELLHRLTVVDPMARAARLEQKSTETVESLKSLKPQKFMSAKTDRIARQAIQQSLSEIFDVLRVSAEYAQSLERSHVEQQDVAAGEEGRAEVLAAMKHIDATTGEGDANTVVSESCGSAHGDGSSGGGIKTGRARNLSRSEELRLVQTSSVDSPTLNRSNPAREAYFCEKMLVSSSTDGARALSQANLDSSWVAASEGSEQLSEKRVDGNFTDQTVCAQADEDNTLGGSGKGASSRTEGAAGGFTKEKGEERDGHSIDGHSWNDGLMSLSAINTEPPLKGSLRQPIAPPSSSSVSASVAYGEEAANSSLMRASMEGLEFLGGHADPGDQLYPHFSQPKLLRPKILAETIAHVLLAAGQRPITRGEFISLVEEVIDRGDGPPIAWLLTQREPRSREVQVLTSEEEEIRRECTAQPELQARAVTEKMVEWRYQLRRTGQESIEESLAKYDGYRQQHAEELRKQEEERQMRECTFSPSIQRTRQSWEMAQREAARIRAHELQYAGDGTTVASSGSRSRSPSIASSRSASVASTNRSLSISSSRYSSISGSNASRGRAKPVQQQRQQQQQQQQQLTGRGSKGLGQLTASNRPMASRRAAALYLDEEPSPAPHQAGFRIGSQNSPSSSVHRTVDRRAGPVDNNLLTLSRGAASAAQQQSQRGRTLMSSSRSIARGAGRDSQYGNQSMLSMQDLLNSPSLPAHSGQPDAGRGGREGGDHVEEGSRLGGQSTDNVYLQQLHQVQQRQQQRKDDLYIRSLSQARDQEQRLVDPRYGVGAGAGAGATRLQDSSRMTTVPVVSYMAPANYFT